MGDSSLCDLTARRPGLGHLTASLFATFAVVLSALPSTAGAQPADDVTEIAGEDLVDLLAAASDGAPDVDLTDVRVLGDVDLSNLQTVDRPVRCLRCTFTGSVTAADVDFLGVVDLSEARFEGDVDARGAVFRRAAVFDGATFAGSVDAGTSRFESVASFSGADFLSTASFQRTVFIGPAVFSGTSRDSDTDLGACSAIQGVSLGPVRFVGATFAGPSRFRERCFADRAEFAGASFGEESDFSLARFHGSAIFERASFDRGASFRVAIFTKVADFSGASIGDLLSFDGAVVRQQLRLSSVSGSGRLDLADAEVCVDPADDPAPSCSNQLVGRIDLAQLAVDSITIDLSDIEHVGGDNVQLEVLGLLETSARADGRTGLANDVRYEVLSRQHHERTGIWKLFDGVFYRDIAGYLVRPTRPLAWMLLLLVVGSVIRTIARRSKMAHPEHSEHRGLETTARAMTVAAAFVGSIAASMRSAFSVSLDTSADAEPIDADSSSWSTIRADLLAGLHRLEWLAFKVLIAVFLLGVANANSTIKELIDSVV